MHKRAFDVLEITPTWRNDDPVVCLLRCFESGKKTGELSVYFYILTGSAQRVDSITLGLWCHAMTQQKQWGWLYLESENWNTSHGMLEFACRSLTTSRVLVHEYIEHCEVSRSQLATRYSFIFVALMKETEYQWRYPLKSGHGLPRRKMGEYYWSGS
jgi:hypothetical protein